MTSSTLGSTMSRPAKLLLDHLLPRRREETVHALVGRLVTAGVWRQVGVDEIVKHVRPREHHRAADHRDGQQGKCRSASASTSTASAVP